MFNTDSRAPKLSLIEAYRRVFNRHAAYFNSENGRARDDEMSEAMRNSGFFDDFASLPGPVDTDVLQHLVSTVGVSEEDVRRAGWVSDGGDLLVPARRPDGGLLGVRALTVEKGPSSDQFGTEDCITRVSADGRIELVPGPDLSVVDVPIPFHHGLFDAVLTWVSDDPVDALFLQSRGVNATSLAIPLQTLGTAEGLQQLGSWETITLRKSHRRVLVVVDPGASPLDARAGLIRGQFTDLWVLGERYTGANLYRWVSEAIEARLPVAGGRSATSLEGYMLDYVRRNEHGRLSTVPRQPLPLPSGFRPGQQAQGPIEARPVSSLGTRSVGPDWLVEDFIARKAFTQYHGVPKEGKSTLLIAMLAQLSLSRDGEFLGIPGRGDGPSPVIYVTEESDAVFNSTVSRSLPLGTALSDFPHFHIVTSDQYFGRRWEDIVADVRAEAVRLEARVIVFDTIANVSGFGEAGLYVPEKINLLFSLAKRLTLDGFAVVAVLHSTKSKGSITDTLAGASTVSGWADQIVRVRSMSEASRVRLIDAKGRFSNFDSMRLQFSPEQVWSRAGGPPPDGAGLDGKPAPSARSGVKPDSLVGRIVTVLRSVGGAALLPVEVLEKLGRDGGPTVKLRSVQNVLRDLAKAGTVAKRPKPDPEDPKGRPPDEFYLPSSPSPSLKGRDGEN